jgi:hypothetical protein
MYVQIGQILNYIQLDVQRIEELVTYIHTLWDSLIQVYIHIYKNAYI